MSAVLRAYERLLQRSERFALADVARAVCESARVLAAVKALAEEALAELPAAITSASGSSSSSSASSSSSSSNNNAANRATRSSNTSNITASTKRLSLRDAVDTAEALAPTFLGHGELFAFATALRGLVRAPEVEALRDLQLDVHERNTVDEFVRVLDDLEQCLEILDAAIATTAKVSRHIADKRDHLAKLLDDVTEIFASSHSKRLLQYQQQIDACVEEYKVAVAASPLREVKQLEFEIKSIETSMAMMLLPHFEICHTITTANAQVERNAGFATAERTKVNQFVLTATKLKDRSTGFDSALSDSSAFITDLKLFERAASKDAFSVCSSTLKLQFRESLDEELFEAYVQDWKDKKQTMQVVRNNAQFQAATQRLESLKAQIVNLDRLVQKGYSMTS